MAEAARKSSSGKVIGRTLFGALIGAGATAIFLFFVAERHMALDDPGTMAAIVAGISYALIGLLVGIGALAPNAGARFLNVEDESELRETKGKLLRGAAVFVLTGMFLLALAAAPSPSAVGLFGRQVAAAIAGLCIAGMIALTIASRRQSDELMRQVSLEALALAFSLSALAVAVWATCAHLGYSSWLTPLGAVAGFALIQLLAMFAVLGRRGLMAPR